MHLSNLGTVVLGAPEMLLQEKSAAVVEKHKLVDHACSSWLTVQSDHAGIEAA